MEKSYVNECESLKNQVYNLNLYIDYLANEHPGIFAELSAHFEGLPGYCSAEKAMV